MGPSGPDTPGVLLFALDVVGIAVFAAAGALAGVRARLDVFGVCLLGSTTALGGGVLRDVLLGITPPTAIADWRYLTVTVLVSLLVFRWHPGLARLRRSVLVLDAFGLGLFASSSAGLALETGAGPLAGLVVGLTTAIGGGVVRDVLLLQIPVVLHQEVYALAALAGAGVVVLADAVQAPAGPATITGVVLATGLRLVALRRGWNAPRPRAA